MIELRRLKAEEFDLLRQVGNGHRPDPKCSIAIVAHSPEKLVGRIFLVSPVHAEGIFIETPWRGKQLFKRLMDAAELEARAEGITELFAYAVDSTIEGYLARLGYKNRHWTVMSKELTCP